MSVAFYFDEHVPRPIASGLSARGVDVLRVQADGRDGSDDAALLDRAAELGRVMFTRDADFLNEAARRQRAGLPFAGVVYAHALGANVRRCIDDLEIIAGAADADEMANQVHYLPL